MISIGQVYRFKPSRELVTVERIDPGTYRPVVLRGDDGDDGDLLRMDAAYLVGWNSFYELVEEGESTP